MTANASRGLHKGYGRAAQVLFSPGHTPTALPKRTSENMDAFVIRSSKKRKSSSDPAPVPEESTDVKLAILSSLNPSIDPETLLDILLAHDGDVETTSQILKARLPRKPGSGTAAAAQSSLRSFGVGSDGSASTPSKRAKILSRKGATLHLYDPIDISEHTPCTIIHNFLPSEEADLLLREMLEESKSFEKITFKLFDNIVSSPHTSGFYVGSYAELQEQKHEYVYNGARMTVDSRPLQCYCHLIFTHDFIGCPNPDPTTRKGQGPGPGHSQRGDPRAHSHSLWREETPVPVTQPVDPKRGLCQLLQRAAGECWLGMQTSPPLAACYLTE